MAYAAVIRVSLDPASDREHRQSILREFVVPEASALSGFGNGMWLNDANGTGTCIVVFDTEEHARAAIGPLTPEGAHRSSTAAFTRWKSSHSYAGCRSDAIAGKMAVEALCFPPMAGSEKISGPGNTRSRDVKKRSLRILPADPSRSWGPPTLVWVGQRGANLMRRY